MPSHYFRMRSIESLLEKHKELEHQIIYFASPEELNDPMEGFRDLYWHGDEIVWRNLFRHYLRCLGRALGCLVICGEEEPFGWANIPIENPDHTNITQALKQLDEEVFEAFFAERSIGELISSLSKKKNPVRRDELSAYIRLVHPFAILITQQIYAKKKLAPELENYSDSLTSATSALRGLPELLLITDGEIGSVESEQDFRSAIFSATRQTLRQLDLINHHNRREVIDTPNNNFVLLHFPDGYVDQLDRLAYPKWYAACFMTDISNSSLWGSYGNNHTGVALKFKAKIEGDRSSIGLRVITGWGNDGPTRGIVPLGFMPIKYARTHTAIDFFAALGNLPIPALNKYWYYDADGSRSSRADAISKDEKAWRKSYWENYYRIVCAKLEDWKHENEYRLLLMSSLTDLSEKSERTIRYELKDLDGIVFGMKTRWKDKLAIMKIIEEKCVAEQRTEFNFYQAYFSPAKGTIEHAPVTLLKFTNKTSGTEGLTASPLGSASP